MFDVFTLNEKKSVLCRFVHFKGVGVTDSRLQNRAYPLFCILQLLYSLYWCSFNLSALLRSGSLPESAQNRKVKLATWEMMFSVIQKKKERKKRKKKQP